MKHQIGILLVALLAVGPALAEPRSCTVVKQYDFADLAVPLNPQVEKCGDPEKIREFAEFKCRSFGAVPKQKEGRIPFRCENTSASAPAARPLPVPLPAVECVREDGSSVTVSDEKLEHDSDATRPQRIKRAYQKACAQHAGKPRLSPEQLESLAAALPQASADPAAEPAHDRMRLRFSCIQCVP